MGSYVPPTSVERVASGQQQHRASWPKFVAPLSVEESTGEIVEVFGVGPGVEATLETYHAASAGRPLSLELGARAVQMLAKSDYTTDGHATEVMSARHCYSA